MDVDKDFRFWHVVATFYIPLLYLFYGKKLRKSFPRGLILELSKMFFLVWYGFSSACTDLFLAVQCPDFAQVLQMRSYPCWVEQRDYCTPFVRGTAYHINPNTTSAFLIIACLCSLQMLWLPDLFPKNWFLKIQLWYLQGRLPISCW